MRNRSLPVSLMISKKAEVRTRVAAIPSCVGPSSRASTTYRNSAAPWETAEAAK